jgi:hypothetical protein
MWCWLKIAAQVGLGVLAHCYDEFSMHYTAVCFIDYGEMHHGDV